MGKKTATDTNCFFEHAHVSALVAELRELREKMHALEKGCARRLATLHPHHQDSGRNLLHYLVLRQHDMRALQGRLAALSLSSLGRAESHVLASINALLNATRKIADLPMEKLPDETVDFNQGGALLARNAFALLGQAPGPRDVRIMVTMPSEAAADYLLVKELLAQGMDCMRINCAHDSSVGWQAMVEHLRKARRELGKPCRVLMDLAGPKLRTGSLEPGAQVLKIRPRRDIYGQVIAPARIWLVPETGHRSTHPAADAILSLADRHLKKLRPGDQLVFRDTRDAHRHIEIVAEAGDCRWAEIRKTAYLSPHLEMTLIRADGLKPVEKIRIGAIPPKENFLLLQKGDSLILTRQPIPGGAARKNESGQLQSPAHVSCTLPEVFADIRSGERIWFDDGKIGGMIREVGADEIHVEITHARPQGEKLRAEKGINLPDSHLRINSFTDKDREDLKFIVRNAHLVGMSFVQNEQDIFALQNRLKELDAQHLGIILKIETRRGFEMLPDLLFSAMRWEKAGVMIARGDLAMEMGYERLAEAQEQILWLCEAAHLPVIWATQVLETLAKSGLPSRAEITDAAMGGRAECVMLNKGPHILAAIRVLDNILQRMTAHQKKKSSLLRKLHWWEQTAAHCDEQQQS